MKLFFRGHEDQYAIEQSLLTLFPGQRPTYPQEPPGGDGELELTLRRGSRWLTATALLRWQGKSCRRQSRAPLPAPGEDPVVSDRLRRRCLQRAFYLCAVDALGSEPPWGMLSGVRPVKLPVRAVLNGASLRQAEAQLRTTYRVSEPRRKLAMDCAKAALAVKASLNPEEISLYVGIPFCPTRCAYCSFISAYGQNNRLIGPYLDHLHQEIQAAGHRAQELGLTVRSVYIGDGTPTTLSAEQLAQLMQALQEAFSLAPGLEFTVEAGRPDTMTRETLQAIRAGGGNRISLNPQSMSDQVLRAMGRGHTAQEIRQVWPLVREAGFSSVNMDLIAGLPEDSPQGFARTLDEVLAMGPENITVHTLALKKGSRLMEDGSTLPDGRAVARMLDYAWSALRGAGYLPYYLYRQKYMSGSFENVGWCQPGHESLYNICMMEELHSVLSLGARGVSKLVDYEAGKLSRFANPKYPQEYIRESARMIQEKQGMTRSIR